MHQSGGTKDFNKLPAARGGVLLRNLGSKGAPSGSQCLVGVMFYSGLFDLVHVKMSDTTALSSSSPHSSVCPSVFSDVSQCWLANLLLHPWNAALVPQDPLGLRGVCRVVPSACQSREALTGALGRGCSRPQPPHTAHSARGSHKPSLNPSHHKAQSGKTVPGRLLPVLSQPMDWIP